MIVRTTCINLIFLTFLFSCTKKNIEEIEINHDGDETIQLQFNLGDFVNVTQESIGGRTIVDEDTWVIISVANNVELQEQYAVFEPGFVEGGYVDTVSLNLSSLTGIAYTFEITAIRRGTSGGMVVYNDQTDSYLTVGGTGNGRFIIENDFINGSRDATSMLSSYHYQSVDSTDIINFEGYPRLDVYHDQIELLVDTISGGSIDIGIEMDRKAFAIEMIIINNNDLDSISLELGSLDTEILHSKNLRDSIYDIRTFPYLSTSLLGATSSVNIYKDDVLIFTEGDVSFSEDKVTRIEIDLSNSDASGNRAFFQISFEDQEVSRGDTVRFGG